MMTAPKVSVFLPVYNSERYLEEAVRSIFAQTFRDFELIAVNDGSTDGSAALLDKLAAEDSRMIVLHRENRGVSAAANTATEAARGIYLARMDADDIAFPERLEKQVARMDATPDLVALGTLFRVVDPDGRLLRVWKAPLSHTDIDEAHISGQERSMICNPTVMMKTKAVRDVGAYSEEYVAEDIDLFLRLAEVGQIANLDDICLDYRLHPKSIGHRRSAEQIHSAWYAAKMAARRRNLPFDVPPPETAKSTEELGDIFRRWGWWALSAGNVATARYYACRALAKNPFSKANWWFAVISLRGY